MKTYQINEIFYSIQGEGMRAGTPNLFVRFSGCNQTCQISTHGFDCDTEFVSGRSLSLEELIDAMKEFGPETPGWVILSGGEPLLQVDEALTFRLRGLGYSLALETNGSLPVPEGIDWVSVSPKVAEHAVRVEEANEIRYVRAYGQGIPRPSCRAEHKIISPAFNGDRLDRQHLEWCIKLVKENPTWRLSVQMHKVWKVR